MKYIFAIFFQLGLIANLHAQLDQNRIFTHEILQRLHAAKLVLIGEPTHGEGNVIAIKLEMVKYLHDSLNYNIIAFESGFYDLYLAQQNLLNDPSKNNKLILQDAIYPIWANSKDFQPFFQYMELNRRRLKVAGFDCQQTGYNTKSYLIDSALTLIKRYSPNDTSRFDKELLQDVVSGFAEDFSFPEDIEFKEFGSQTLLLIKSLKSILSKNKLPLDEAERIPWYIQSIYNVSAVGNDYWNKRGRILTNETFKAIDSNPRDSMMAQNVLELTKLYPNEKIICWGAGPHFINNTSKVENEELHSYRAMGAHLKKSLGDDKVFNLTFISGSGTYGLFEDSVKSVPIPESGSIEASLSNVKVDTIISLKNSTYHDKLKISYCIQYSPIKANWSDMYDAFVYLPVFTPNVLFVDTIIDRSGSQLRISALDAQSDSPKKYLIGKILDTVTHKPIAFVDITCATRFITQTNNNGEFQIMKDFAGQEFNVHQLGYQTSSFRLSIQDTTVINLRPNNSILNEVRVTAAKKLSGLEIFKRVKKNYQLNYGREVFKQAVYVSQVTKNFDSVIIDRDLIMDNYINFSLKNKPWTNFKEKRININKEKITNQIGPIIGMSFFDKDYIRTANLFKGKRYRKIDFELIKTYYDDLLGKIYVVAFKAKSLSLRYTTDWFTSAYEGTIDIREEDYAVLKCQVKLKRDISTIQKWTLNRYSKFNKWDAWRVYPTDEEYTQSVSYYRSPIDGIYYIRYANIKYEEKGYLMKNKQPVQLITDNSYYDLGQIEKIPDQTNLPFSTFKQPSEAEYHAAFWNSFISPKKNDQIYTESSLQ